MLELKWRALSIFGVSAGELVLNHENNLSLTLQSSMISAGEGLRVASVTFTTLAKMRTDEAFTMFWALVQKKAAAVNVSQLSLPCRRNTHARFETGNAPAHFSAMWRVNTARYTMKS